ncbi:6868_t:CDS:2, partial [Acaulospora colombiana]
MVGPERVTRIFDSWTRGRVITPGDNDEAGETSNYEMLKAYAAAITMILYIVHVAFLFYWQSPDLGSDASLKFYVALAVVFAKIRTPMHGILASTELLCEYPLSSPQRALTLAIQNAGINIIHMTDHVLRTVDTDSSASIDSITFEIVLPMEIDVGEDDENKPLPSRYVREQVQTGADPKNNLKVGVIRSTEFGEDSATMKRIIAPLDEFDIKSYAFIHPDDVEMADANTIVLDFSCVSVEQVVHICRISKENNIFVICILPIMKHLEVTEKAELCDKEAHLIIK